MKRFVEGEDRTQSALFPERLDEYISEDNPVRIIEAFVDELDLKVLGFEGIKPSTTGRPAYHPSTLLKLYIYGYLNRIQSSRRLERESQRNVEVMWLTRRLMPDHKTIAEFRKNNGKALRGVCRDFVVLCRGLSPFTEALVAIDGSKFIAVNIRDKKFTRAKMKRRMEQVDQSIERYLGQLDSADREEPEIAEPKTTRLKDKIETLRQQMQKLKELEVRMLETPDQQLSLTDPDARSMATSGRGTGMVGYNVQTAVDAKHHLIVAHEVTNVGHDRDQLSSMAKQARTAMGSEDLTVVADRGYFKGEEILACDEAGITTFLPKPQTSGSQAEGRFGKRDFHYIPEDDEYRCPAGERLKWRMTTVEKGQRLHRYWSSACPSCSIKARCTPSPFRRVTRWEHEEVIEAVQARLDRDPEKMRVRRQTAEHPFGTIKAWMGSTHFLTKTLECVSTEMSLHVLAYNLKRVMSLLGVAPLIEAIRA
ncbi:MAG: IS1182 family transposase [Gammaproteobacteria bacterium]